MSTFNCIGTTKDKNHLKPSQEKKKKHIPQWDVSNVVIKSRTSQTSHVKGRKKKPFSFQRTNIL